MHGNALMFHEDLEVGRTVLLPARTLTKTDRVSFAGLSGDFNRAGTDAEFAGATPFGQRIARGLTGISIASGLAIRNPDTSLHQGVAFLGMKWDFRHPPHLPCGARAASR